MKDFLPEWKTKIAGWATALGPVLIMLGLNYDPEAVLKFLKDSYEWIAAGHVGLAALVHWFRNLANR